MLKPFTPWFRSALAACFLFVVALLVTAPAHAANPLVTAQWLQRNHPGDNLVLIDASVAPLYMKGHIPGAVHVDVFGYGGQEQTPQQMEERFRAWGISAGKRVVIYDEGGSYMATRVFFDLYYHGFPASDLFVLDGGLAKWKEIGGAVTTERTPPPAKGTFRVGRLNADARVMLNEFTNASGDPQRHAIVDALEPGYYFGAARFFDRAGHVPHAILFQSADFFNADKTFKSADEIRRMATYLGIRRDQQIHTYCGGGVAAAVPFFALRFIADYPKVSLYKESQREWLRDERSLPVWTYGAPTLKRDPEWLNGWSNAMLRMYGVTNISIVDVRPGDAFQLGHIPYALNVPADVFRSHLDNPGKLAELLGAAGVNSAEEAVIVSEKGLNQNSALAFLLLERLGQKKVSILMDSVDDWGLRGYPLTKEPTLVGKRKSPKDLAVPATVYQVDLKPGTLIRDAGSTQGQYPKVFVAAGKSLPANAPQGLAAKVVHVPHADLLNADGTPKPAKDLMVILTKAGVPRYAEIVIVADDPGAAAINYFVFRLMGYPDVKVMVGA
jgi:3-mercaptopyruvate sulfurtransferase SseA